MLKTALNESVFNAVPYSQWLEKAKKDLRETAYHTLFREIPDLGTIEPYYSLDYHSKGITLPPRSIRAIGNDWQIRQSFSANVDSNTSVIKALEQGLQGIDIAITDGSALNKFESLLEGVFLQMIEVHLSLDDDLIPIALDVLRRQLTEGQVSGSIGKDLFAQSFGKETPFDVDEVRNLLEARIDACDDGQHIRCLVIEASSFYEAGSTDALELAYALAVGKAMIDLLLNDQRTIDDLAPLFEFRFSASPDHFVTIAKFRAFRHMWAKLIEAYEPEHDCSIVTWVHAQTSTRNFAERDQHNNLLRTTTSAMAAISASVDSLNVVPFSPWDVSEDSRRWARNIHHLLREEAHFAAVEDPSAGSYHTEELTRRMITASSTHFNSMANLFLDLDARNHLKNELFKSREELIRAYQDGHLVIVGENKFESSEKPDGVDWGRGQGILNPLVLALTTPKMLSK